jgi:hypothetical protein
MEAREVISRSEARPHLATRTRHRPESDPLARAEVHESEPHVPEPARTFPVEEFASNLDPAVVKARYLVGPIDPTPTSIRRW